MTNNRLRDHFPMLRDREEFLNFCTGIRGVKVLYDCFFKEIFNPDENRSGWNDCFPFFLK